ncbi:MAG: large subunit ribosomal protein L4e [Thermoplasmata archaeon]|nr:large subunit ribosomal protein L4e [Thermoplasmata archaeon]
MISMVKVNIYSKTGAANGEVELPAVFETEFRPDVIRKTVNSAQANRRQAYGPSPLAGHKPEHSVRSGQGISRVPRATQGGNAVFSPAVVGGRRAHPPRVDKVWSEKTNKKERALARASALGATANEDAVRTRGHQFKEGLTLPVVVDDAVEAIEKTKDLVTALEAIGVGDDLVRADEGKHQRAGRGKMRGRRYKTPKSILFVVSGLEAPVLTAARNLTGVDVATPEMLSTELVAPGGDAGRLVVFTKSALNALEAM